MKTRALVPGLAVLLAAWKAAAGILILVCFVILVAGVICSFLIDAANALPIDTRALPLPAGGHASVTNRLYSTAPPGTILSLVSNTEYYVEGDIEKSTDMTNWVTFSHFGFWLNEENPEDAESWQDGPVSGSLTVTLGSDAESAAADCKIEHSGAHDADEPPCGFYAVKNLAIWRHDYYRVVISQGSPY